MDSLMTLRCTGTELSLAERGFFDGLSKQIAQGEKEIPWKSKKQYRVEVSKKSQEYVLRLIDVKTEQEIERLKLHSSKTLLELETQLLSEVAKSVQRHTMQAALEIQKDFRDAQELARKIDPEDAEFTEEFLKDLRNVALTNVKNIAHMKERQV